MNKWKFDLLRIASPGLLSLLLLMICCVQLTLHFMPYIVDHFAGGGNLAGGWDICVLTSNEKPTLTEARSYSCKWMETYMPGRVRREPPFQKGVWFFLKRKFQAPGACSDESSGCYLFVTEVRDSAEFFVNGRSIGSHGRLKNTVINSELIPGALLIQKSVLQFESENIIEILLYTEHPRVAGILNMPFRIVSLAWARIGTEGLFAGLVGLCLVSAFGTFVLAILGLFSYIFGNEKSDLIWKYILYCLIHGVYLISLSRVPRTYIPNEVAYCLHFFLRYLGDLSLLALVSVYFQIQNIWITVVRWTLLFVSVVCIFCLFLPPSEGYGAVYVFSRGLAFLSFAPILIGAFASFRHSFNPESRAMRGLFVTISLMQVWDFFALLGYVRESYFCRFYPFLIALSFGYSIWTERFRRQKQVEIDASLADLANQVAHDIRSPLAALDAALDNLAQVPEERRVVVRSAVRRIRDIANTLNRDTITPASIGALPASNLEPHTVQLLFSLVDNLVTEKRLQFRSRLDVAIYTHPSAESYGLFVRVQPSTLKRVISNLINNGVESLGEGGGQVEVQLLGQEESVVIEVRDNGRGIPNALLGRLMTKGFSHGKENGTGLGLFHAKGAIESWGGGISIDSTEGKGTRVKVKLPRANHPGWFVPRLQLSHGCRVYTLDDDLLIHQIWRDRLQALGCDRYQIEHRSFSTSLDFCTALQVELCKDDVYLIDYELLHDGINGLELIDQLGIQHQSLLVTSRYEEEQIQLHCQRLGVRLVPKGMAGFIPIAFTSSTPFSSTSEEVVLIDDDPLVRANWRLAAKAHSVRFHAFSNAEEFNQFCGELDREKVTIYIDSSLGRGIKGEEVAKVIRSAGFSHVYLATGYPAERFVGMTWLCGVVGKDPPWG